MKDPHKKDNLTDLVDILGNSQVSENETATGQVVTSGGEVVTLCAEDDEQLTILAKKLLRIFKDKQKREAFIRAVEKENK